MATQLGIVITLDSFGDTMGRVIDDNLGKDGQDLKRM